MSIINNNLLLAAEDGGYVIDRSLRFRSSASAYLNRTPASAGNRRTFTYSFWFKRGALSNFCALAQSGASGAVGIISFNSDNTLGLALDTALNGTTTTQVFRDPSAWYHVVVSIDTTQATASNRVRIYVNGVQVTSFSATNYPAQNFDTQFNTNVEQLLAGRAGGASSFDGYLTEINFIDGQALTPDSFGEFDAITGVWKPKAYTGTYGTNGFYLNFSNPTNTTTLTADQSGNGNNWTANNISLTSGATYDSMIDTPTPVADERGNFCVLNPLAKNANTALTNANLSISSATPGTDAWYPASSTIQIPTSGQWYCEFTVGATDDSLYRNYFGIITDSFPISSTTGIGNSTNGWAYFADDGKVYNNSSAIATLTASVTNDVIGLAFDSGAGSLRFYKNGVAMGASALTGFTSSYFFACSVYGAATATANFGQRPFAYTPPSGFKALHTGNLPEPAIVDGGEHFNTVLYTGTGSARSVTGVGFQPGLVWTKARSTAFSNHLADQVRGATKYLNSNLTNAEMTFDAITSFDADGFSVGTGGEVNGSGVSIVAWNWKANGAGVTNTAGSITSTVSANPTAGFSIVTYTGNLSSSGTATVGHGLGVAPRMIITKRRNSTSDWVVQHAGLPSANNLIYLNTTQATNTSSFGTIVAPTSSVFTTAWITGLNTNGDTHVAYCFAEVPGYSRFGSYTGNGLDEGAFVFCGFRPRWVLIKESSALFGSNWSIMDTTRSPANAVNAVLYSDLSNAEGSSGLGRLIDVVSNGFKIRNPGSQLNHSGATYIFAAFAEVPFKVALAR